MVFYEINEFLPPRCTFPDRKTFFPLRHRRVLRLSRLKPLQKPRLMLPVFLLDAGNPQSPLVDLKCILRGYAHFSYVKILKIWIDWNLCYRFITGIFAIPE